MLTRKQADQIVQESMRSVGGDARPDRLVSDSVDLADLTKLAATIAGDAKIGVLRFQHTIDPNRIAGLVYTKTTKVGDLMARILEESVGKLCSNPSTPHEQECCPYPATCPQCGYPVL